MNNLSIVSSRFAGFNHLKKIALLATMPYLTACAVSPATPATSIDYAYQRHSEQPKVLYESHNDKQALRFMGGSAAALVQSISDKNYFLAFADSNHYQSGIRQKALDLIAQTKIDKVGVELSQDAGYATRIAYNQQFSYPGGLQPVMIDINQRKRQQLTQHPAYKYAYGAISPLKYKNILRKTNTSASSLDCEFLKYRIAESDVNVTKNVINQQLDAMIFGISHFTYRLNGQPAGIDNHLEKTGRQVKTIAIVAANQAEYKMLKSHFPTGDLIFANGLADIDYTLVIQAETKMVDELTRFYHFYDRHGNAINPNAAPTHSSRCRGLVPGRLVTL